MKGKIEVFFCSVDLKICDYQNISDPFVNFVLTLANKMNLNIHTNNHCKPKDTSVIYLSQLFNYRLAVINFRNTSNQELKKIIYNLYTKYFICLCQIFKQVL